MTQKDRSNARAIAQEYVAKGKPLDWFEVLYANAHEDAETLPWADLEPNPHVVEWFDHEGGRLKGHRALKIGCGLGDDAEFLSKKGFSVTAFDISQTAIEWCHHRFPDTPVAYEVANLFSAPVRWTGAFDFVLESYTLQVLPAHLRPHAIERIASFVAPGGTLLVIARGREPGDPEGSMPWPLTKTEMETFKRFGPQEVSFEDFMDQEDPPTRRFRAVYKKE
jgi:2-polyprenyl-3-methyl-5-hydroxy-6-metoxy-1,4-benzoquinol methylase